VRVCVHATYVCIHACVCVCESMCVHVCACMLVCAHACVCLGESPNPPLTVSWCLDVAALLEHRGVVLAGVARAAIEINRSTA